jgi:hypothetical protein
MRRSRANRCRYFHISCTRAEWFISLCLQLSTGRPKCVPSQASYPRTKSPDLLKRVVAVVRRWKLASGHKKLRRHSFQFFQSRRPHFFSFSRSSTRRRIRFLCDVLQSFSMEASVCLPCDVSQKWSGLEPWQWCRRCSRSGRALEALCPVRASKAVVASLSFPLHLLEGVGDRSLSSQCCSSAKASHAASIRLYRL